MNFETMKDGERAAFEDAPDGVFSVADVHAIESREDGSRLFDRGGLLAFASDISRKARAASPQSAKGEAIPEDCDVRKILLRVVPGDGSGHEVYAKNVGDVEQLLTEMGERLDDFEGARAAAPQAALTIEQREALAWARDKALTHKQLDFAEKLESLLTQAPTERMSDAAREEAPSLTNPLTPYGMLVRALRIVAGTTLYDMAQALLTTPAKLSAMEFGREQVTQEFAFDVSAYFDALGVPGAFAALDAARKAEIERDGGEHGDA
jgi:hypothetical protein